MGIALIYSMRGPGFDPRPQPSSCYSVCGPWKGWTGKNKYKKFCLREISMGTVWGSLVCRALTYSVGDPRFAAKSNPAFFLHPVTVDHVVFYCHGLA